ncbi:MarR family winged helix-turn-helix transcriptional regulator [Streptomyces sp. NPDC017993]|uniref:MarR family winged helix-turn-helix transcriptional regulator n=1 Tax=Streptomyces sp. NPDC017993 TaxID=3365027 RepID=UPI0037952D4C
MDQRTVLTPADPAATDDDLATQPIGYWSGLAHRAVIGRIRDEMARIDVAQPQWWTLNRADAGDGPVREEVIEQLAHVGDGPQEIARAIDQLLHRGWLTIGTDHRLSLTDSGRTAKARIKQLVIDLRAEIHEGITDEDYVTALKVLRRMTDNVARQGAGQDR